MRHARLDPDAIAPTAQSMGLPPPAAPLVAPTSLSLLCSPGFLRTTVVAIDLTSVAAAANKHLGAAAHTQKEADWLPFLELPPLSRTETRAMAACLMPAHSFFLTECGGKRSGVNLCHRALPDAARPPIPLPHVPRQVGG